MWRVRYQRGLPCLVFMCSCVQGGGLTLPNLIPHCSQGLVIVCCSAGHSALVPQRLHFHTPFSLVLGSVELINILNKDFLRSVTLRVPPPLRVPYLTLAPRHLGRSSPRQKCGKNEAFHPIVFTSAPCGSPNIKSDVQNLPSLHWIV